MKLRTMSCLPLAAVLAVCFNTTTWAKKPPPDPEPSSPYTVIELGAPFPFPDGASVAYDISDNGYVLGTSYPYHFIVVPRDTDDDGLPDVWFKDQDVDGVNDLMVDLVGHPQWELSAASVNSHGQVAVSAPFEVGGIVVSLPAVLDPEDTNGDGTPDTWYRDTNGDGFNDLIQPLDFLYGWAAAINERGWVCVNGNYDGAFLVIPLDLDEDGRGDCWYADEDEDGVNDLVFYLSNFDERASMAYDLNDAGEIVGHFTDYDPVPHIPFKTDIYGQIAALEDLQDWDVPWAINNLSQAVGESGNSAVLWEADRSIRILFPGNRSMSAEACDINDLGQVAITTTDFRDRHVAYVLDSATMTILGENPGVVVSGINNHGYLSGHVFITNPDTKKPDLARACVLLPPTQ